MLFKTKQIYSLFLSFVALFLLLKYCIFERIERELEDIEGFLTYIYKIILNKTNVNFLILNFFKI